MKRPHPNQLPLFAAENLPPPLLHDPDGGTYRENARWLLEHRTGRLAVKDNGFLYGISHFGKPLSEEDRARLSELHRRVGGRPLSSFIPWELSP